MYGSWSSWRNGAAAWIRVEMSLRMMIRLWLSIAEVKKNLSVPYFTEKARRLSSGEMGMPPLPVYDV